MHLTANGWSQMMLSTTRTVDMSESDVADWRRARLAVLFVEADRACRDGSRVQLARNLQDASTYVAGDQEGALLQIAELCAVDFDLASARWAELRLELRVRRDGTF